MLTVGQLIEYLQDVQHEVGEDAEVRIAHQPHWAFEYSLQETVAVSRGKVYLAEGTQVGYLPQDAAYAVGWTEKPEDDEEGYDGEEEDYEDRLPAYVPDPDEIN